MGFFLRAGQLLLSAAVAGAVTPSCYSAGAGTSPPPNTFYFPVGLAVSRDGNFLYAANSDFDLQWNGGTLQSYNLAALKRDTINLIQWNLKGTPPSPALPLTLPPSPLNGMGGCRAVPPGNGVPLGQSCSPPADSTRYNVDSVIIGAFATDLQFSTVTPGNRLFMPVRGNASLTWADVNPTTGQIDCGQDRGGDNRCDSRHQAGSADEPNNTRMQSMPGEPFGMAQTMDGTAIAITHQTDTKASLLLSGLGPGKPIDPSMQFVLDGLPTGGIGLAAVPHDVDLLGNPPCEITSDTLPCVRPAFLETNRNTAEIDLLRYHDDDMTGDSSSNHRPFLQREGVLLISSNAIGTDSRGIVIDPTPRLACKAAGGDPATCAKLPARVFFASRTPPALAIGEIGGTPSTGGGYDPDRLVLTGNVPLPSGPSNVYLAPIIDQTGRFSVRVFVTIFDPVNQIAVYDPDGGNLDLINVGQGPFAMAFDPYLDHDVLSKKGQVVSSEALMMSNTAMDTSGATPDTQATMHFVAEHAAVHTDPQLMGTPIANYRFAYVANFTQSYVQVIDLDNSQPTTDTFEQVVFTLGLPTKPKGQ